MRGAIILAGGNSVRFGSDKLSKEIFGETVLQRSVDAFCGLVDCIVIVGGNGDFSGATFAPAGTTRFHSVKNGLAAMDKRCNYVAIHDAARPFVTRSLVEQLFSAAEKSDGSAVPCVPCSDTVYSAVGGVSSLNRGQLFCAQTPQVFDFQKITAAYDAATDPSKYSDDGQVFLAAYGHLSLCSGEIANRKVTYPSDLPDFRIGNGYDVHKVEQGGKMVLCGVTVASDRHLVGHSDADVATHALMDAILAASGNKDIGTFFPDTDDKYLGANSISLLEQTVKIAASCGFAVVNASVTIAAQQPKLSPFIDEMCGVLAEVLGVEVSRVTVHATTTEGLGVVGRGEGVAAYASAVLARILPTD